MSEDLFEQVQIALRKKASGKSRHLWSNPDFPLRRFVRCAGCGGPFTGSWSRGRSGRYAYYHCAACKAVRVPGPRLAAEFLDLLGTLRPAPTYVRLFEAIVKDVWAERHANSARTVELADQRARGLRQRLSELDETFVFTKAIDGRSYNSMRDELREELALAEIAAQEARIEELDIEAALAASEMILSDAGGLWLRGTYDQRAGLQAAIFPEGLAYDGEKFGTAVTCIAFSSLQAIAAASDGVASPPGFALWAGWPTELEERWGGRRAKRSWRPHRDSNPGFGLERAAS